MYFKLNVAVLPWVVELGAVNSWPFITILEVGTASNIVNVFPGMVLVINVGN